MTILFSKARELFEKDYQDEQAQAQEKQELQAVNATTVNGEDSEFGKSDATIKHQPEKK